jgi:hypothetical protein
VARRVVVAPRLAGELERVLEGVPRGEEAFRGFQHVVGRRPEQGLAVRGRPDYFQRPFHAGERSFTVIYTFDEEKVVLLAIREVPSSIF